MTQICLGCMMKTQINTGFKGKTVCATLVKLNYSIKNNHAIINAYIATGDILGGKKVIAEKS